MIDTVYLIIKIENYKLPNDLQIEKLGSKIVDCDSSGFRQEYHLVRYKNLRIKIYNRKISIVGSLSKFYFGNNLQTLQRFEVLNAFKALASALKIEFDILVASRVMRLDIGLNLSTDYLPSAIIDMYTSSNRYRKDTYNDAQSVYFQQENKAIVLYDKTAEHNSHRKNSKINEDIVRFEFRVKNSTGIQNIFGGKIYAHQLYNPEFFERLLNILLENYNNLNLSPSAKRNISICNCKNIGDLENLKTALLVEKYGDKIETHLKQLQKKKNITRLQKQRFLQSLQNVKDSQFFKTDDAVLKEVDKIFNFEIEKLRPQDFLNF